MGFEPFIPPKRTTEKAPEGSREEKVTNLAKLLHSRGLTSSMADARRLAEGMVDVEKKVMKQPPKDPTPIVPAASSAKADLPDPAPHDHKQSLNLSLPESFAHFVAQAATLSHRDVRQSVEITAVARGHIAFGREQMKPIAEVPHFHAHKQVFFEDAPPITAARGFGGGDGPARPAATSRAQPDFQSQREETLRRIQQPSPSAASETVKVDATDAGIMVARTTVTPKVEIVEERMIIEEPRSDERPVEATMSPQPVLSATPPAEQQVAAQPEEQLAEKTVELPKQAPKPKVDLAKEHGVDIFEMFKKK